MYVIDFESFYGIICLSNGPNLEVTRQYALFMLIVSQFAVPGTMLELGESSI
jgi:hypothetical protein